MKWRRRALLRGEERRLGNDFLTLVVALPVELDHRAAAALEVIERDGIALTSHQRDRARIQRGAVIRPVFEDELVIYDQPYPVIRVRDEGVGLRILGHDVPRPAHGKVVGNARNWRIGCPGCEVDGCVGALHRRRPAERCVWEIPARETGANRHRSRGRCRLWGRGGSRLWRSCWLWRGGRLECSGRQGHARRRCSGQWRWMTRRQPR